MTKGDIRGLVLLAVAAAIVIGALNAGPTLAGRGGNGGGGGGKGGSSTVLTVAPNPVPFGTNITINGSGFRGGQEVVINTSHLPSPQVTADANGNFSFVYNYQYGPGNAAVQAFVMSRSSWVMVAQANFTVCSTNPC